MSPAVAAAGDARRSRRMVVFVLLGITMKQPAGYGCSALVAPAPMMTKSQSKRLRKKSNMVSIIVDDNGRTSGGKGSSTPDLTSEIRALVKSSSSNSSPRMPPWLANYDDLVEDSGSSNTMLNSSGNKYGLGLLTTRMGDEPSKVARTNVARLKAALERHHKYLGVESECFSKEDIADVMDALRVASGGEYALLAGAAEFLWLLLSVEENQFTGKVKELVGQVKPQTLFDDEEDYDAVLVEDDSTNRKEQKRPYNILTRDTLIASAFHYADCVEARRTGVYGLVSQAVRGMSPTSSFADSWKRQLLPASASQASEEDDDDDDDDDDEDQHHLLMRLIRCEVFSSVSAKIGEVLPYVPWHACIGCAVLSSLEVAKELRRLPKLREKLFACMRQLPVVSACIGSRQIWKSLHLAFYINDSMQRLLSFTNKMAM